MKTIALAIVVSIFSESMVEYGQTIYEMIEECEYKKAIKQGAAIAIAIVFAYFLHVTFLAALVTEPYGATVNFTFDIIVTGIVTSRGANYVADLIRMVQQVGNNLKKDGDENYDDEEDEEIDDEAFEDE